MRLCSRLQFLVRRPTWPEKLHASSSRNPDLLFPATGLLVPTLLHGVGQLKRNDVGDLELSRGISSVLLILYFLYIRFQVWSIYRLDRSTCNESHSRVPQLFTNRDLFEDEEAGQQEEDSSAEIYLSLKGSVTIALCSRHMRECWLRCAGGCIWLAIATIFIALLSEIVTGTLEGIHHDEYCYVAVDTCNLHKAGPPHQARLHLGILERLSWVSFCSRLSGMPPSTPLPSRWRTKVAAHSSWLVPG